MSRPIAKATITVLGIETSCDDTAAAIVRLVPDAPPAILSNVVFTQHAEHAPYGGVVPEIAARSHVERLDATILAALSNADLDASALDGVAATAGPGLVGGVLVGLTTAKAIALTHRLPIIPVNHLEGHALSVRLTEHAPYPYLLLLISGGHSQLVVVEDLGIYQRLGTTIDDAAGEAFDKTAKLLALGQPGGPQIERAARNGDASRFQFPRPLLKHAGCNFSFSGMKTAVREAALTLKTPNEQDICDVAASFQFAVARHLCEQTRKAMTTKGAHLGPRRLVVAGGVAANSAIRNALQDACDKADWTMLVPPPKYCTDNGAMIAWAGAQRIAQSLTPTTKEALTFAPLARWPLAPPIKGKEQGGGKKGPKA